VNEGPHGYYDALRREAAHRLADALTPYRVLTRAKLAEVSGASHWNTIGFDEALRWAVDRDFLRRLDGDLYEIAPGASRDDGRRLVVEGGW
jgi:hypothetical protein